METDGMADGDGEESDHHNTGDDQNSEHEENQHE